MLTERLDRRLLRLANEVERAGQQHGHGSGLGHRSSTSLVGMLQMIGRQRGEFCRERSAAEIG